LKFKGALLEWFRSYLGGRTHKVKVNNILSEEPLSEWEVPQGSVLGPILVIIYINGLYSLPLKALVIEYADDTSLLYSAATKEELVANYEHDRIVLFPWIKDNLLHLNLNKCKYIIFGYKTPMWADKVNFKTTDDNQSGERMERVEKMKYLGLTIDEKLTWRYHLMKLQAKLCN